MGDGPEPEALRGPLNQAFEVVLRIMLKQYEPSLMVRDPAAWAISLVCSYHTPLLDVSKHFEPLVKVLLIGLDDEARVARNVAFAIHNLARAYEPMANQASNPLSQLFQPFIAKL